MTKEILQTSMEFMRIWNQFKLAVIALSEAQGLTMPQVHVLYILHENADIPTGKVAKRLWCDASNVTGIIDRLVSSGLVERHEAPEDRRTKLLRLTDEGKKQIHAVLLALPQKVGFDKLSQEDHASLRKIISKLQI